MASPVSTPGGHLPLETPTDEPSTIASSRECNHVRLHDRRSSFSPQTEANGSVGVYRGAPGCRVHRAGSCCLSIRRRLDESRSRTGPGGRNASGGPRRYCRVTGDRAQEKGEGSAGTGQRSSWCAMAASLYCVIYLSADRGWGLTPCVRPLEQTCCR